MGHLFCFCFCFCFFSFNENGGIASWVGRDCAFVLLSFGIFGIFGCTNNVSQSVSFFSIFYIELTLALNIEMEMFNIKKKPSLVSLFSYFRLPSSDPRFRLI